MAAPSKVGLDYYPRSTDLYEDVKFIPVKIKYGYICYAIYDILLELIYRDKGYYVDKRKNVVVKIAYMLQGKYGPDTDIVEGVIEMLVAERLFSADHYKQGIITSRRVQETYYIATARRKNISVDPNIWMLSLPEMKALGNNRGILSIFEKCDINEVNVNINGINVDINEQREIEIEREKKRKENEKKEREKELSSLSVSTYGTFANVFLTDSDLEYLKARYPSSWQRKIDNLSEYMRATGKEYSDHLATLVRWAKQDEEKNKQGLKKDNFNNFQGSSYTEDEKKKILELKKARQKGATT